MNLSLKNIFLKNIYERECDMKFLFLLLFSFLFFSNCSTPPEETQDITNIDVKQDITEPILLNLTPYNQQRISDTPLANINIKGILKDDSPITATLDNIKLNLIDQGNGCYQFQTTISLIPGENTFLLKVQDSFGNKILKEITYFNGQAPRLILKPERNELPPNGKTFFEVVLEREGQTQSLSSEEVNLHAQRGSFQGLRYNAPSESGSDLIFAECKAQNAKGKIRLTIRKTDISLACIGSPTIRLENKEEYSIQVSNHGEMESLHNKISLKLPETCEFISANKDGEYLAPIREIQWRLDTLGIGITETLKFVIKGNKIGKEKFYLELRSGTEIVQSNSTDVEVIGAIIITHDSNCSIVNVDQEFTTSFHITAQEALKNFQILYKFDNGRTIFQKAFGKIKGQGLKFTVSENTIIIHPDNQSLQPNEIVSGQIQFRSRRAGTIRNEIICNYKMINGQSQTVSAPLTITSE